MEISRFEKTKLSVRNNLWWAVPPLVLAVGIGVATGLLIWLLVYAVGNLAGVWLYCDHHGPHKLDRQRWVKMLAIPLLPTGLLGALTTGGGSSPSDKVGAGSADPGVRSASASASANSPTTDSPSF